MFCSVARSLSSPEDLDKLARIFNEQAIPLQERMPGFKGVYIVAKPNGEFMIFSMWDSEEQANAWLASPEHINLGGQLGPLTNYSPPEVGSYDVLAFSKK